MRLYLSSFRNGNQPAELLRMLAGKKRTALIANSLDNDELEERSRKVADEIERLESIGLEVEEVDLRGYFDRAGDLQQKLVQYDLIWARGGNVFTLRRAFKQSGADEIIRQMLIEDQIVYGGYSAGIDMLVPSLRGAELVDDAYAVPEGYEEEVVWDSLGLLPYAVAPHYKSDHPESADIDTSIEYMIDNHIPFIALRDGEAIVVDGDVQRIVGSPGSM